MLNLIINQLSVNEIIDLYIMNMIMIMTNPWINLGQWVGGCDVVYALLDGDVALSSVQL